jgi:hypothetical protein
MDRRGIEVPFKEIRIMKRSRITVALALIAILSIAALYQQKARACGGTSGAVCTLSQTGCLKSMVLAQANPSVIVAPPGAAMSVDVPFNLFITSPPASLCATGCTGENYPVSASAVVTLHRFPCQSSYSTPDPGGSLSTNDSTLGLPTFAPLKPGFNLFSLPLTISPATTSGLYCAIAKATVVFSDGMSLTATSDQVVCLDRDAGGRSGKPRLDIQLLSDPFPRCAPGDQVVARYRITNNDPEESVRLTGIATSKQIALRPTGGNESQGVFAIADPYGDDFPIAFDPEDCISLPNHPYTQGELREKVRTIRPGRSRIVEVGIRTHGGCATASCSQSALRVEGTFSGGAEARACAGLAVFADTSVKSANCGSSVNDCNLNGAPDADDIANGTSQDQNFNGTPDECEQGAPLITEPVQITPSVVEPGQPIHVRVFAQDDRAVMSVLANGVSLSSQDGKVWEGDIPSSLDEGAQSVFAMAEDADHKIATHIGVYDTRHADFTIEPLDTQQTVSPGDAAAFRVQVIGPPSKGVSLSVEAVPPGATASFSEGAVIPTPGQGSESRLTISTSEMTPQGIYTLTLRGSNRTFAHEASLTLIVKGSFDFSLQPLTPSQTLEPGGSAPFIVVARLASGMARPVTMSVEGLPLAAISSFSINPVTPVAGAGSLSVLTIGWNSALSAGSYSLTIVGTSGALRRETSVTLQVQSSEANFGLQSSASSVALTCGPDNPVDYGCGAEIEITAALLSGNPQAVILSVLGLPEGAYFYFSSNPVTPGSSTTLVIGMYPRGPATHRITVVGTSGTLIRAVSFDLIE